METNFSWFTAPYLAAGIALASEIIIPEVIYWDHNRKKQNKAKESEGVLEHIISKEITE